MKDNSTLREKINSFYSAIVQNNYIVIYKARNGELAVKFPSSVWRDAFINELGGQQNFTDHPYFSNQPCPKIFDENLTTLYIQAYKAKNGELAVVFPNLEMRESFIKLLRHSLAGATSIYPNQNPVYFNNRNLHISGYNFTVVAPVEIVNSTGNAGHTRNRHAPANTSSSSNTMPESLQSYINSFNNAESFQDAFKRLNIETKEGLICNISLDVPNVPVYLSSGQLYDWEYLKKLPVDSNNNYTDPMTSEKFTLANIIPGRAICTILENQIKEVDEKNAPAFKH